MRSYLGLRQIQVISFDLDDTLYDNRPIIKKAELQFLKCMQQIAPATHQWQSDFWLSQKQQVLELSPELSHDTWQSREQTLKFVLKQQGISEQQTQQLAKLGMEHFLFHRSNFTVPQTSLELLNALSQHYPLIGISNGNVDPKAIGIADYFQFILHSGNGLRMKPAPDMFSLACERLQLAPEHILHVGDNPHADVVGAKNFGCQAAWLNPGYGQTERQSPITTLPHIELSDIQQLRYLLP
ncbi:HAD-IA family hydrolase [Parashewanella tropica]|uniref:HAD-IA family hydrolase n=1 Tax=Parashewanella tropica TaxID=2547970 RepID=UPI001059D973|nr:HAD-IA family hydrolase [Parashewanella tropica]